MRVRVGRDVLGDAVAFVSRVLPSRPVVPLLSGMLVEASEGTLTISCFDYEVSARCRVEAEVIEPGTVLVPGRLLAEITRSLPARPAEFAQDGDVLNLACGAAEFGLVCLPTEDYPALPGSPKAAGLVDGATFGAAVSQVASSASKDDTLPMLTAICLDIDGEILTLAATDRYRLAVRRMPFTPASLDLKAVALVPARMMVEAARMLPAGAPVTLAFDSGSDGLISFESGDRRLTARLIGGEFIKYQSRLAAEFGCYADIPPGPVIEAVRRAALVAERAGPIRLTFGGGNVMIEAHAEGRARATETVAADFAGDQPVISFNPHYLLDGLVAAASAGSSAVPPAEIAASDAESATAAIPPADRRAGSGRIRLQFSTPTKPALITWAGESGAGTAESGADPIPARAGAAGPAARVPPAGAGSAEPGATVNAGAERAEPEFRYLLVPVRVSDRA